MVVDFFLSGYSQEIWNVARPFLTQYPEIVASVAYLDGVGTAADGDATLPLLKHIAGPPKQSISKTGKNASKEYHYPKVKGQWYSAGDVDFDYAADSVAHTRNLQFLKPKMGGPYFDLEAIWEEHTYYEFADRSVEHTMSTMVQEPYVNHIPTVSENVVTCSRYLLMIRQLTGGVGRDNLSVFYRNNFIFNNSADTDLELVSRTIGIDRVIDEFIFKFTHDRELDWLCVPPSLPLPQAMTDTYPVYRASLRQISKQPFHSPQWSTSEATGYTTSTSHGIKAQLSANWACCQSTSHSHTLCPGVTLSQRVRKRNIVCLCLGLRRRTSCGTGRLCLRMGCLSMPFGSRRVR
jgi:hypothetical protein